MAQYIPLTHGMLQFIMNLLDNSASHKVHLLNVTLPSHLLTKLFKKVVNVLKWQSI